MSVFVTAIQVASSHTPQSMRFIAELIASHFEIDAVPEDKVGDYDYCPWNSKLNYSPGRVIISCVWSKATYVGQLVERAAPRQLSVASACGYCGYWAP
jgi:hypothetical protein